METHFTGSRFDKCIYCIGSQFTRDAYFNFSEFVKDATFEGSEFNRSADFGRSTFKGDVNFNNCQFNGPAYFSNSYFNKKAYFKDSKFLELVIVVHSEFGGEAYFGDSLFNGNVEFDNVRFKDDALFENTRFNDTLSLKRTKYTNLYIKWTNITRFAYDDAAYLSLIDNFKKLGFFEDADNCYYQYRKERNQEVLKGISQLIDNGLMTFYGYGVRPFLPFTWSLAFIVLFGVTYLLAPNLISIYTAIGANVANAGAILHPFNISLTVFLSGAKLVDDPKSVIDGFYWIFTLEKLLGSLFLFLFLVSFGKTIVR